MRSFIGIRNVLMGDMAAVKAFEKRPMLYVHIIGPINARTNVEINQYNIDEFRKYAKIVFHLMSRDVVCSYIYIYIHQ